MRPEQETGTSSARGVLYLVGTPIGNLQDITLRALETMKRVQLIACEDTRRTRRLLDYYGISTPTVSYHEHNERARARELLARLEQGAEIALVSDAGMPAISDPGYRLVSLAVDHGIAVVPIPGPTALIAALAGSGLPTDSFRFLGFLPARSGPRRALLEGLRGAAQTNIFYEAPHRLLETLRDIVTVLGPSRPVVVARELTKVHEQFMRGPASEVLRAFEQTGARGEITLLIGKDESARAVPGETDVRRRVQELMAEQKLDEKAALKIVARERGIAKSQLYRELHRGRSD